MAARTSDLSGSDDSPAARAVSNTAEHFVGLLSPDGIVIEANTVALDAAGLSRGDVIGQPFWEAHWWSHDPAVQQELRDAIGRASAGEQVRYRVLVRASDQGRALLPIDFVLTPLHGADGRVAYLVPEGHPVGVGDASMSWADLVAQLTASRTEVARIRDLATGLAAGHSLDDVVAVMLDQVPATLGVDFCNVAAVEKSGRVRIFNPMSLPETIDQRWDARVNSAPTPITDALRANTALEFADLDELAARYPHMVEDTAAAGLVSLGVYVVRDAQGRADATIGLGSAVAGGVSMDRFASVLSLCGTALQRALATRRSEENAAVLDAVFQQAPIGIAFFDLEFRFARINAALAAMNGPSVANHLGKAVADVVPEFADQAVPLFEQVIDTGEAIVGLQFSGATSADSSAARTWEESFFPVVMPGGEVIGVGAVAEDVTDRLEHHRRVESLNARLSQALRFSDAGVYQWYPEVGRVEWTPEFADLYGFDREVTPSFERWFASVHPADRRTLAARAEALLTGEDDATHDFRIEHPRRGVRWIHGTEHIGRAHDGTVETIVGINIDVTDQMNRESELATLHHEQRRLAERLQNGLLPSATPKVDGLDIAVRYLPSNDGLRVGGDWYDVIKLSETDVAIVVGDVVGHDLDAAIAMGQIRYAVAALSYVRTEPADLLADLDQFVTENPALMCTTVFYARLNPETGELRYASAGHHPPIVARNSGGISFDEHAAGTPIGIPKRRTTSIVHLDPGDLLIAYTDGLIEHRSEPIDTGRERLTRHLVSADHTQPLQVILNDLTEHVPHPERADDIAVVAIRRH